MKKRFIGKKIKSATLILMLTVSVLLSFSIHVSAGPGDNDVWCLPENDGHVEMGDVFNVTFNITINEEINSIGLNNITFNQTVTNGTGTVVQGNALVAGSTTTWITTDWSTNAGGYAAPLATWAKTAGTNNSVGVICNTTWNAIAVGVGHINFTDAGTSYGATPKGTVFHNGTVYVHPAHPVSPSANAFNETQINLSWTKGSGADQTVVVAKENSLPVDITDGAIIYNNTGTVYNHDGLSAGEHWYYRFYSWHTSESMFSVNNMTADDQTTQPGDVIISSFLSSHQKRHCVDWVNHSVNVINATSIFLNITCADSTILSINITQNNTGNYYWCNRSFDNGVAPGGPPYGWPEYGNGSYVAKIYGVGESDTSESSTLTFYIYPNADADMNNQTWNNDISTVLGVNWASAGASRFCVADIDGNGQVWNNDISAILNANNWAWAGGT